MAQFRYFSIPSGAKILISATLCEADIPKGADGGFVIPLQEPQPVDPNVPEKPKQTGIAVFGGKQNVDERAGKIQIHKLLEAGFLPNNIFLVANRKLPGEYTLRVWLDCALGGSGKSFADRGEAGKFALEAVSAKRGFVMVYDNGDMWSFNMSGRVLDDRHSTYFGLVPRVITPSTEDTKPAVTYAPRVRETRKTSTLLPVAPSTTMGHALLTAIVSARSDLHHEEDGNRPEQVLDGFGV